VVVVPQSFCTVCRRRIPKGSRCKRHPKPPSPSSRAWRGASAVRQEVLNRDRGCRLCGRTEDLQVHHVVPARDGGATEASNLLVLCGYCHLRVEKDEPAIPAHIPRTDLPEGLRTAYTRSDASTDIERNPKWG
jgi:5-methylcytosine-specific restriction endonuclease McrA